MEYQRYEFDHATNTLQVIHEGKVLKDIKIKKNTDGSLSPDNEFGDRISFEIVEDPAGGVRGKTTDDDVKLGELTEWAVL